MPGYNNKVDMSSIEVQLKHHNSMACIENTLFVAATRVSQMCSVKRIFFSIVVICAAREDDLNWKTSVALFIGGNY